MAVQRRSSRPAPALVALASWLVPGGGYWLLGKRSRGTTIGITILALFVLGLLIGGIRVITAPDMADTSLTVFARIGQRPWYIAQIFNGPICLLASMAASRVTVESHSHSNDIGQLYTAIAGMLNLLAIIDAWHRAGHEEAR